MYTEVMLVELFTSGRWAQGSQMEQIPMAMTWRITTLCLLACLFENGPKKAASKVTHWIL